ncbi:maltose permease MAL31 [Xylariales sp. PMI_506]|nr:maltose permease MAL31 [Xylariales sp. PMI_506]
MSGREPISVDTAAGGGGHHESVNLLRNSGDAERPVRDAEHALTPRQAIKAYPMAIFWTLAVSMTVIMEGYDTILIGSFFAYPTFAERYGQRVDEHGNHQLSAAWQATLSNMAGIGSFFGVLGTGYLVERYGQKRVIIGALCTLSCFIFLTFSAPNIQTLAAGEFLCGLPWGVFASSAPAYASEVLPMTLRIYLTSYTNMCFIIGQLIAAGVLATLVSRTDEWAFRIPFAIQWVWPAFLIPLLCFAPESPWHHVRKGELDKAEKSLRRLKSAKARINVKETLAGIVRTDELEKKITAGTSYWDCLHGVERRRTEIACMAFAGQMFSGLAFAYNSTYFFQQVGLTPSQTYRVNIGGTVMALSGTLVSWFALMPYYGRRRIFLYGMFTLFLIQYLIGILNLWTDVKPIAMTQAVLTLVWTFVFQLSIGQLGWALPAEVSSTRLRQRTVCLARNAYYLAFMVAQTLQPFFMNPTQWNLKGYTGFFWGTTALLTFVWAYYRLPETGGRTYEELDWLFARRTPARKFESAVVDLHADSGEIQRHSFDGVTSDEEGVSTPLLAEERRISQNSEQA